MSQSFCYQRSTTHCSQQVPQRTHVSSSPHEYWWRCMSTSVAFLLLLFLQTTPTRHASNNRHLIDTVIIDFFQSTALVIGSSIILNVTWRIHRSDIDLLWNHWCWMLTCSAFVNSFNQQSEQTLIDVKMIEQMFNKWIYSH